MSTKENKPYNFIAYDLGKINTSEQLLFQGKLIRLGPEFTPQLNPKLESKHKAWLASHQLWDKHQQKSLSAICFGSQFAFRENNVKILMVYTLFPSLILLLDDVLDDHWRSIKDNKSVEKILHTILQILEGNYLTLNEIPYCNFPKSDAFYSAFFSFYQLIFEYSKQHTHFLKSLQRCFSALIDEFSYRQSPQTLTLNNYLKMRSNSCALESTIELAFLLSHIKLSDSLRNSDDFRRFKFDACIASVLANDVLSFPKELAADAHENNYILIKQREEKLSLQSALDACNSDYNDKIKQLLDLKEQIVNNPQWSLEKDLLAAIQIIEQHVQAHLEWALQTKRYH